VCKINIGRVYTKMLRAVIFYYDIWGYSCISRCPTINMNYLDKKIFFNTGKREEIEEP
jgi:hypothetical protein